MQLVLKKDCYLLPSEAAKRLGLTVKALRLYERQGLVKPLRSGADWRTYGPEQMAKLHQVLVLKSLGLSLASIAELLAGSSAGLALVLELQEQTLRREGARLERALATVRAARAKLDAGKMLSIDDLAKLTTETTMSTKMTRQEYEAFRQPLIAKHFPADKIDVVTRRYNDTAKFRDQRTALIEEATRLMQSDDTTSTAALDWGRKWGSPGNAV